MCTTHYSYNSLCDQKCDEADFQTQVRHANNSQKAIKTSIHPHAPTGLSVWIERRWILREIYSFPEAQSPQTSVSLGNALPPSTLQPPCSQTEEIGGLVSQTVDATKKLKSNVTQPRASKTRSLIWAFYSSRWTTCGARWEWEMCLTVSCDANL